MKQDNTKVKNIYISCSLCFSVYVTSNDVDISPCPHCKKCNITPITLRLKKQSNTTQKK